MTNVILLTTYCYIFLLFQQMLLLEGSTVHPTRSTVSIAPTKRLHVNTSTTIAESSSEITEEEDDIFSSSNMSYISAADTSSEMFTRTALAKLNNATRSLKPVLDLSTVDETTISPELRASDYSDESSSAFNSSTEPIIKPSSRKPNNSSSLKTNLEVTTDSSSTEISEEFSTGFHAKTQTSTESHTNTAPKKSLTETSAEVSAEVSAESTESDTKTASNHSLMETLTESSTESTEDYTEASSQKSLLVSSEEVSSETTESTIKTSPTKKGGSHSIIIRPNITLAPIPEETVDDSSEIIANSTYYNGTMSTGMPKKSDELIERRTDSSEDSTIRFTKDYPLNKTSSSLDDVGVYYSEVTHEPTTQFTSSSDRDPSSTSFTVDSDSPEISIKTTPISEMHSSSTSAQTNGTSILSTLQPNETNETAVYTLMLRFDCNEILKGLGEGLADDSSMDVTNCSSVLTMKLKTKNQQAVKHLDKMAGKKIISEEITLNDRVYEIIHLERHKEIVQDKKDKIEHKELVLYIILGSVMGVVMIVVIAIICCRCFKMCCCKNGKSQEITHLGISLDDYAETRIPRPSTHSGRPQTSSSNRNSFTSPFSEVRNDGFVQAFDTCVVPLEDGRILDDMVRLREGRGGNMRTFNSKRQSWMNNNLDDSASSTERLHQNSENISQSFGNPTYGRISATIT